MTTQQPEPCDDDATRRPAPNRGAKGGRQDRGRLTIRLLPDEREALEARAREAGLSMASYARAQVLGTPGPRARRSPTVNTELLARAVAHLNRIGSNVNQIARALNFGSHPYEAFNIETLAELRQAVAEIRDAVGRKERP